MAGHEWEDWFEREEFIGQISDIRVQNLQVERELVQKRTFTRWMNLHLEKCDPPIEVQDLFLDIQDGHILMALLEELSGCKMLHKFKRSTHRIFRLNNIAKVLSFLEERNVKLVSIDAADVADGNSSIILGLIWNIILFFQIKELTGNIRSQFPSSSSLSSIPTSSDSDTSCCSTPSGERQPASTAMREHSKAIKKLLQWVQKRTRKYSVAVKDFGKSWTSGLAFLAVIKSIDPSLVDMRKALLRNAKDNLEDSFRIAHYSLGIPRLLEPEDVTINAPDEQSIMTYVSQFLEHFPGREEPEEPVPLIERSVSMGRLHFREKDSNHIRNSIQQSRVKERSHMFQRVCTQQPPKILISSVSEDRSAMSPPFRTAAARSWSSEDLLADSPHISSSVAENPQESASEVLTNSTCNSPQLSYANSPTGSSVPESVTTESVTTESVTTESVTTESLIGDSAISSPDSWVESEFGVGMQERFCESQSDGSLCDSGTAWDVYRATPVEVTNLDEGCDLSMEERAPEEESISESYIDEGICSLSSLESAREKSQGHFDTKQPEVVKEKEVHLEKSNQDMPVEKVPDHSKAETAEEEQSEQTIEGTSQSREPETSLGLCNAEELRDSGVEKLHETDHSNQSQPKRNTVEERAVDFVEGVRDHEGRTAGQSVGLKESGNSEELQVETECQEREENKRVDGVGETQEEASEGVLREDLDPLENFSPLTLPNTGPTNKDRAPETSLDPSAGIDVPLISISSEPEEQNPEEICDPERQHPAWQDEVHHAEGTDTDVDCPQNPHKFTLESNVEIPSRPVTESEQPKASEQTRGMESKPLDEHGTSRSLDPVIDESDTRDKMTISECELTCQTCSSEATSQPVAAEQEVDSPDHPDGHKYTSSSKDTATTEQNTPDAVNPKPNGTFGPGCLYRDKGLFYSDFDQSPAPEGVVGDPVEPMDLFYPDKEEPMFLEPPDAEMQSWPSVLSVSALKPAPASETPPDQPLSLLDEDFSHGVDWTPENDEIPKTYRETDTASKSPELCVLPGETIGGVWGDDAPADGSDLRTSGCARENTEPVRRDSDGSIRPDESHIPPVLRHRKGARLAESTDNQPAVTAASRRDDSGDSDSGCSDSWELYVLLLLWLLLYCFWLLPQMDLKTLPSLLLNLEP
ncbi:calmin isoform X2 [Pungitius pungitius]|uniref:calmin isoform X2 n=1 Tax=Pungitius pungitius TaxID=134920 RepID=UPI002E0E1F2C